MQAADRAFAELLAKDVVAAAPRLLGAILSRENLSARIVEVEAYRGIDDPACHAFQRPRMKNMALYGPPGIAYVYFAYGNHWMLNLVAHPEGDAAAILIRAAVPLTGIEEMRARRPKAKRDEDLLNGPGKLAQAFAVTPDDNGKPLLDAPGLSIPIGEPVANPQATPRIGIAIGKAHDLPWRFIDPAASRWLSHR